MEWLSISPKRPYTEISVRVLKSSISCLRNGLLLPRLIERCRCRPRFCSTPENGCTVSPLPSTAILPASTPVFSNAAATLAARSFESFRLKAFDPVVASAQPMISTFASELAFRNSANAVIFSCSEVRICAEPMLNKIFLRRAAGFSVLFISGVCTGAGQVPARQVLPFLRAQLSEPALRVRRRLPDAISCSSCRSGK